MLCNCAHQGKPFRTLEAGGCGCHQARQGARDADRAQLEPLPHCGEGGSLTSVLIYQSPLSIYSHQTPYLYCIYLLPSSPSPFTYTVQGYDATPCSTHGLQWALPPC